MTILNEELCDLCHCIFAMLVKFRTLGCAGHDTCVILQGNASRIKKNFKNNYLKDQETEKDKGM
jgi:hypothetical protein